MNPEILPHPTSPASTPPVAPLPEPKSKVWVWILGGIVLLGVGIVGGVFLGKQLYSKPTPQPTPSPIAEATPTPDPTANWKLISRKNWQFKVPPKWNYWECSSDLVFVGLAIPKDQTYECAFDGSPGTIQVYRIYKSKNPEFRVHDESSTDPAVTNRSTLTVDGKPAIIQLEKVMDGQGVGTRWIAYIQQSSEITDIITLHEITQKTTFDQILSTFKFLDQNSDAEEKFCGGIAANLPQNQCPEGYTCKLENEFPDAGGVCTK